MQLAGHHDHLEMTQAPNITVFYSCSFPALESTLLHALKYCEMIMEDMMIIISLIKHKNEEEHVCLPCNIKTMPYAKDMDINNRNSAYI